MEANQETNNPKPQISKPEYWQQHIKDWKESGQARTAHCSQNNLRLTTFRNDNQKLTHGDNRILTHLRLLSKHPSDAKLDLQLLSI